MNIQFILGHIDLDKLENIDAIICPTDTHLSGSGGLDKAIHQAAGPELKAALKGQHLAEGEARVTDAFHLNVKRIVHAAVPKAGPSGTHMEMLRKCYRNALGFAAFSSEDTSGQTAAIPLLGTGFCGWSFKDSMAALWAEILEYHRNHGSEYFGKGCLETLYIYYPQDAFHDIFDYTSRTSQAFFHAPEQWGTRGDPYMWYALMDHFDDPKFNRISPSDFILEIQRFFHNKTGKWLCGNTNTYVEEWAHGGMSSGVISSFFAQVGIPLLVSNLVKLNFEYHPSPSFLIPVTLRCGFTEHSLTLPNELLPELTHLRNPRSRMNAQIRLQLVIGQPYYLTTHHYHSAPSLVDFYSLDVESASDSHYHFTEDAAASICKQLGYAPNAIGAALSDYLKKHGGSALEALVQKHAREEFHYH